MERRQSWARALVLVVGSALTAAMLALGVWQADVFLRQGEQDASARAQLPPVDVAEALASSEAQGEAWGRRAHAVGRFLADQQVVVGPERRVVIALALDDGRVLPVVRGTLPSGVEAPPPPPGSADVIGVLLPSEPGAPDVDGRLASVRLPRLAQQWPQRITPGFVTVAGDASREQGLSPASVSLPSGEGSARNQGYALQWWVFAGFAAVVTVAVYRSMKGEQ